MVVKETSTAGVCVVIVLRWGDGVMGIVMIKGAGKYETKHVTTTMMTIST